MPTFWYFLLLLLSTCNGERKSGCLLNDKNKMFWRTADAPGTNVSCSWRVAIAMGTGYRDQSRRRRGIFSFCPLDNHSKKPEENECPWTKEVFDAVGAEQKTYILSRNFNPPPPTFLYEMPSNRVRKPRVRPLPRGSTKLESRLSVENPRVTVYRTYSWTYLISRRA